MPPVMPHLLYVSATDAAATYPSITAALRHANAGDTVVGAGHYTDFRQSLKKWTFVLNNYF